MGLFGNLIKRLEPPAPSPAQRVQPVVKRSAKTHKHGYAKTPGGRELDTAHALMARASKHLWRAHHAGNVGAKRIHGALDRALEMVEERGDD